MMILIKGKPDSGKSARAEETALKLKASDELLRNRPMLYLATMIPFGEEGKARVEKHRAMRKGKGFVTLEIPKDIPKEEKQLAEYSGGICLLECMANLSGNEMHSPENADLGIRDLTELLAGEILWLDQKMKHLIVVTDVFDDLPDADEDTKKYLSLMEEINRVLEEKADRVEEINEDH